MKRIIVIAMLAVFVLSLSAFAADAGKKMPMAVGFNAGVSLANATGSDATIAGFDKKMKIGFAVGGYFAFSPVKSFTIQPEIMYVQKGVKYDSTGGTGKRTLKIDFIEIPVLAKFTPELENSKIAPTLFAGPFVGLRMSAKAKGESFTDTGLNGEIDIKDLTKSTEFGVTFGGGLGYKMTKGELFFDARYDVGLSDIQKDDTGANIKAKSSTILVLAGYKFDI